MSPPTLHSPSDEQQAIIDAICEGRSVAVNAVAGSGKSTTVLCLAEQNPDLSVLLLSYNRDLKLELRGKAERYGIGNIEVHSYHSLAVKYYKNNAHTDEMISAVVSEDTPVRGNPRAFDVVVTDEAQDIIPIFQRLVNKFLADSGSGGARLVVMGDERQAIYGFKGADERFLTLADRLRPERDMLRLSLTTSYRLTDSVARFVNEGVLGKRLVRSAKAGGGVEYYVGNVYKDAAKWCYQRIRNLLATGECEPEDIFVLCSSVKSDRAPYKILENMLSSSNIPCFVPMTDESQLSDKIIKGKVTFTTFHQSKGRERKAVFVYGFDAGYYKAFRGEPRDACPHPVYVALTRPTGRLFLVQSAREDPPPFLKLSPVAMHAAGMVSVRGSFAGPMSAAGGVKPGAGAEPPYHATSVTDLVRFLKPETLVRLDKVCNELFEVQDAGVYDVEMVHEIETANGLMEQVSDINGLAIPSMWEQRRRGSRPTVHRHLLQQVQPEDAFLASVFQRLPDHCHSTSDFLFVANAYQTFVDRVYFKMKQIKKYDWLDDCDLESCLEILDANIGAGELEFERNIKVQFQSPHGLIKVHGRTDVNCPEAVYEIKCTRALSLEHKLQTVVYKWMHRLEGSGEQAFVLLNTRTGERLVVREDWGRIQTVVNLVIENRYKENVHLDDAAFVEANSE